jgi:hypothetical protein
VTNDHQYISSSSSFTDVFSASSCGTRSHPWHLEAPLGQRISVSLLDFPGPASSGSRDVACLQYGYVVEKSGKKNVTICGQQAAVAGSTSQRESIVYESEMSSVDITLASGISAGNSKFLIKIYGGSFSAFLHSMNTSQCSFRDIAYLD